MATRNNIRAVFANMVHAARWAGIDTTGLSLQEGSSTNGIAYRVYMIPAQSQWPYCPPGGFIGKTRGEAIRTLDTMRHVFEGIGYMRDQQERAGK